MNFDQFVEKVTELSKTKPSKIQGISNVARTMDGFIFLGGPNLESFDGLKSYSFCSKISITPSTHLFFCLNFGSKSKKLYEAVAQLDQKRINNCKVVLDNEGLFISTNGEINSGTYHFNENEDKRIEADAIMYVVEGIEMSAIETLEWIKKRFKGNIASIRNGQLMGYEGTESSNMSTKFKHPLNQILYGPPGTGKTHNAINHALAILKQVDLSEIIKSQEEDKSNLKRKRDKIEFDKYVEEGRVRFVTFHQSYSYEEFVEGIRPFVTEHNQINYRVEKGIFSKICKDSCASQKFSFEDVYDQFVEELSSIGDIGFKTSTYNKDIVIKIINDSIVVTNSRGKNYHINKEDLRKYLEEGYISTWYSAYTKAVGDYLKLKYPEKFVEIDNKKKPFILIIDEINRGNISKIFGELITLIEPSKRLGGEEELKVKLTYSGADEGAELFGVPANLYIIGTMNTADKSIALIDLAIRRRFNFIEYSSKPELLSITSDGINLENLLSEMNNRISFLLDNDHLLGHAYFFDAKDKIDLCAIFRNKIIPLLKEYFYNDFRKIALVFGDHKDWKKDERLYLIRPNEALDSKKLFGKTFDDEFDGKEESLYELDKNLKEGYFDKVSLGVFISIYDREYVRS